MARGLSDLELQLEAGANHATNGDDTSPDEKAAPQDRSFTANFLADVNFDPRAVTVSGAVGAFPFVPTSDADILFACDVFARHIAAGYGLRLANKVNSSWTYALPRTRTIHFQPAIATGQLTTQRDQEVALRMSVKAAGDNVHLCAGTLTFVVADTPAHDV